MTLVDLDLCQLESVSGGRTVNRYRVGGQTVRNSGNFAGISGGQFNGGITIGDFFDQRTYRRTYDVDGFINNL